MSYKSYLEISKDLSYAEKFSLKNREMLHYHMAERRINLKHLIKLRDIWMEQMREDYEKSASTDTSLGKFLKKYPLKFKEFCCLLELIEDNNEMSDFEKENWLAEGEEDTFKKHKVWHDSSQLKRYKLVFKIINPLRPMKVRYEPSYRAQVELQGKKYTDEYQQLDLALEEASKINTPDQLESLYYLVKPRFGLNDLIAPPSLKEQLATAMVREQKKDLIMKKWQLSNMIEYGRGTTLNFRGPPGTGKTLAAHCLAKELQKELLIVRYDQLQNMYIGQTEKHIRQVFKIAARKQAILFFDEADAVALSRHNLERSWEMSQINTLLKELERFEGVCIFATNFAEKYDAAFERRLTMHIDFKMPTKEDATIILSKLLPAKAREKELSLDYLNLESLSGGDLKNVVLNAAGIAAKNNSPKINRQHIEEAIANVRKAKNQADDKDEMRYIS